MKTIILLISICLLSGLANAQSIKKDYYDYQKNHLMAEYQINSSGEKHGWFKGYDEQGVLVYEYNYSNGLWHGLNKEYVVLSGKRVLAQSETYANGVLEGPAKYYSNGGLIISQGNYSGGEKTGEWIYLESYNNYDLTDEQKKDCEFVRSVINYTNGKNVLNGKVSFYFYPSGKLRSEHNYLNGEKVGEHKWYLPNGQLENEELYDDSSKLVMYKLYFTNGQLRHYSDWRNGKFHEEKYDETGKPNEATRRYLINTANSNAWKLILAQNYPEAITAAELGLKYDPTNLYLLGNYAHALLLNGEYDRAIVIYKAHLGESLTDALTWNDMIVQDFADFKSKGIESENFDTVLVELNLK